jgi:hypothetical protein
MAVNCYCHPHSFECPVLYGDIPGFLDTKPNYPVPAISNQVHWDEYFDFIPVLTRWDEFRGNMTQLLIHIYGDQEFVCEACEALNRGDYNAKT